MGIYGYAFISNSYPNSCLQIHALEAAGGHKAISEIIIFLKFLKRGLQGFQWVAEFNLL